VVVFICKYVLSFNGYVILATYANKLFCSNFTECVLQEDEQLRDAVLYNPHLVRTSIHCKESCSPTDLLNRGYGIFF
jgi:hypothetical protein